MHLTLPLGGADEELLKGEELLPDAFDRVELVARDDELLAAVALLQRLDPVQVLRPPTFSL